MNKFRKNELTKSILELEKPYPSDCSIETYSDFLKVRKYLHYHQFNPVVFLKLLELTTQLWTSTQRINRLSLLTSIKQYLHVALKNPVSPLTSEINQKLFEVFRIVFEHGEYISPNQLNEAQQIANNILINIKLKESNQEWLCKNTEVSHHILNRTLRYPFPSVIITEWATQHFYSDSLRNRRAELISRKIDFTPEYVVDPLLLVDDFEYFNKKDKEAVKTYLQEVSVHKIIENQLGDVLPKLEELPALYEQKLFGENGKLATLPELILTQRFYPVPLLNKHDDWNVKKIPDFKALSEKFYQELENIHKITMIWSIGYSRIQNTVKTTLLQKYYCDQTYFSMYKVAKKNKNTELLKWMLEQQL